MMLEEKLAVTAIMYATDFMVVVLFFNSHMAWLS
jgi:hypothetical protein